MRPAPQAAPGPSRGPANTSSDCTSSGLPAGLPLTVQDTPRVADLRRRVREAMDVPPVTWECPVRISDEHLARPIAVRKALAIGLKLSKMPTDPWDGQLFAGSMTLESPRLHCEWGFPDYLTGQERQDAARRGLSTACFGHIVPDYPTLLEQGLEGIRARARAQAPRCRNDQERAFLESVLIATGAVMDFAARLAERCEAEDERADGDRASELRQMAANLRQAPAGPARTFWQALQSVWLLHMVFHSTLNGNAMGRLDQYTWPLLRDDLEAGRLDLPAAGELVDCFCLKFNERAKTTEEQRPEARQDEPLDPSRRTRRPGR